MITQVNATTLDSEANLAQVIYAFETRPTGTWTLVVRRAATSAWEARHYTIEIEQTQ